MSTLAWESLPAPRGDLANAGLGPVSGHCTAREPTADIISVRSHRAVFEHVDAANDGLLIGKVGSRVTCE